MAPQLKNTLAVTALAPGASIALSHNLNNGKQSLSPDIIILPTDDLSVTGSDTSEITVMNIGVNPVTGTVFVESWHTFEREFGGSDTDLPVKPYIVVGGGSGTGGPGGPITNFVFRPGGVQGDNVFTDWEDLMAAKALVQGWKTIQFDGSLVAPTAINLPADGIYDMTDTEWFCFANPLAGETAAAQRYQVNTNNSQFPNLQAISGEIQINNNNTTHAMITLPATGQQVEVGAGAMGSFPIINCNGSKPFIDASALAGAAILLLRLQGTIQGTTPAIDFGAVVGSRMICGMFDQAGINAGMIIGTGVTCSITLVQHANASMAIQPNFLGVITRSSNAPGNIGITRFFYAPYASGVPTVPATADISTAAGLAMQTVLRLDATAPGVQQTLPMIRAAAPAVGANVNTAGCMDAMGMVVIVKNEKGANSIDVFPNSTRPDTIEGGAGPVAIPAGGSRIFMNDGTSNWIIVGGYL